MVAMIGSYAVYLGDNPAYAETSGGTGSPDVTHVALSGADPDEDNTGEVYMYGDQSHLKPTDVIIIKKGKRIGGPYGRLCGWHVVEA